MINANLTSQKQKVNKLLIFLLYLSFIWISIYPVASTLVGNYYFSYGNIFDGSSMIFSSGLLYLIINALVSWIGFELIFIFYRFVLAFKIYSFVVPQEMLKNDMRTFYIYRNLIYGLFVNLCFFFPYLNSILVLVDVIVTMMAFILFSCHIKKKYSEPIVGHFVFKCFMYPVAFFEAVNVLIAFLEVI